MPAFAAPPPTNLAPVPGKSTFLAPARSSLRSAPAAPKRRRAARACAAAPRPSEDASSGPTAEMLFEDIVTDDEYVVVDGQDVVRLVEELQRYGLDDLEDAEEGLSEDFLTLAEKRSDEQNGRSAPAAPVRQVTQNVGGDTPAVKEDPGASMEYFKDDHVQFMPSWAAQAYEAGEHTDLEKGASRIGTVSSSKRLHDIVARKKLVEMDGVEARTGHDGIVDCTVADISEDYSIPAEFVIDAMLHFGVPVPIKTTQSVRDSMTSEEISKLLNLITSFDAQDLGDRYSDRTISELADDYDLPMETILGVCAREALYVCLDEQTRLSTVREDRVLDIILKGTPHGQPYPSLLDGLIQEDSDA